MNALASIARVKRSVGAPAGAASQAPALRAKWLFFFSAVGFSAGAVATAPASLYAPLLKAAGPNVVYERLDGTIWRGAIRRVTAAGHSLGDVDFTVSPLSLLLGKPSAYVEARGGAAVGQGALSYGIFDRTARLADADVNFDLSSIERYTLFGIRYDGRATASLDQVVWRTGVGCRAASGRVWTDLLDEPLKAFAGEGAEVNGALACDGPNLALRLTAGNRLGDAEILVTISGDLNYGVVAEVSSDAQDIEVGLKSIGFQERDGAFVYDAFGPIKGLGS